MKVLILTYYWPPAGGSGVQRWLKFVKYLPEFGIEPIVYTVDNASYPKTDNSLINEIPKDIKVIKNSIWEPTDLFFWKKKNEQKRDISNATSNGLLSFIRGNFFVPDPKIFWVNSSVKFLSKYLKENPVDLIITTGPPHSVHLIAKKITEQFNIKWIADFRDPWADLYYQKEFKQLNFAKNKNKKLERLVLQNADHIVTVSESLKKDLEKKAAKVSVITNGFDDEVLSEKTADLDSKFSISYIGLLPKQSNPKKLFKILNRICQSNKDFKKDLQLNFIGDIADEVRYEIEANQLDQNSSFIGYVSHQKAIDYQKKSQVLLLLIPNIEKSEGILTGKLFEYLTAKRPILALSSSKGDLHQILEETKAGSLFLYDDEETLTVEILRLYELYKQGKLFVESENIEQYHRKNLTKQLSELIKNIPS